MLSEDYYEVMGIPRDATDEEIRRAYRRLIKRFHPDLNPDLPNAESRLRDVMIAYQTLGNRRRRADYDKVIDMFGSRRKAPFPQESPRVCRGTIHPPSMERRRQEAVKMMSAWVTVVLLGILVYGVFQSRFVSERLIRKWPVTPAVSTAHQQLDPAASFAVEPAEDQWYLRYRKMEYQLMGGEMGSSRGLAEAYVDASKRAMSQGRYADASVYARMAHRVDPACESAKRLVRNLYIRHSG